MGDIIFVGTRKHGLRGRGKLTGRVFLPPFKRAMARSGLSVSVYESIDALQANTSSHQNPVVILVYSETFSKDEPRLIETLVNERYPEATVFNGTRTARIIRDKRLTNDLLRDAGIAVPSLVSSIKHIKNVFSNEAIGSRKSISIHGPDETLDGGRYNVEYVNTLHNYRGRDYFVCLRAMAVADKLVSVYVRARPADEGDPSVHNKNTPLDANLINHLYFQVALARIGEIVKLCRELAQVLGLGFYAHDILPCADTGRLFVCESGFKFNDMTFRKHLAPIGEDLAMDDFLRSTEATRAAYAFLSVLHDRGFSAVRGAVSRNYPAR